MERRSARWRTTSRALAVGAAIGLFGVSFGVLCAATGLSPVQASVLSMLVFTGASQFAAVGVLAAGGSPVTAVLSGLLLAMRNAAYGLAIQDFLPKSRLRRAIASHLIVDESVALSFSTPDEDRLHAFLAGGISIFFFWNLGTIAGAWAGSNLTDPMAFGLDAAFPASLLALLAPRLRERAALRSALGGAAIALLLTPLLPPGLPILAAGLIVVSQLAQERRR